MRTECFLEPFTTLSERSGFSIDTISQILEEEAAKFDEERKKHPVQAPRVLGIDEKHLNKEMRGVLTNIETGCLLDIFSTNDRETMQDGIRLLANWNTSIQVVTTDMNNSYLSWLSKLLPNATVVIDKFHVLQDVSQKTTACRNALKEYRQNLINQEEDIEIKKKHTALLSMITSHPRLFNYSMDTLQRQKTARLINVISAAIENFPEYKLLYNYRYAIENMYNCDSYEDAEAVFDRWQQLLPPGNKKAYTAWCKEYGFPEKLFSEWRAFTSAAFSSFKPFILNYFRPGCRFTNAATEGLNRLIDQINTEGNGYSFSNLRAKCLYSPLVHEQIQYGMDSADFSTFFKNNPPKICNRISFTGPIQEIWYTFTETRKTVSHTPLNIFADNSWLHGVFQPTDDSVRKQFAHSMQTGNEKCPTKPIPDIVFPIPPLLPPAIDVELVGDLEQAFLYL